MKGPDDGVEASATLTWNESRSGEPADSVIDAFVGHRDDSQGRSTQSMACPDHELHLGQRR